MDSSTRWDIGERPRRDIGGDLTRGLDAGAEAGQRASEADPDLRCLGQAHRRQRRARRVPAVGADQLGRLGQALGVERRRARRAGGATAALRRRRGRLVGVSLPVRASLGVAGLEGLEGLTHRADAGETLRNRAGCGGGGGETVGGRGEHGAYRLPPRGITSSGILQGTP